MFEIECHHVEVINQIYSVTVVTKTWAGSCSAGLLTHFYYKVECTFIQLLNRFLEILSLIEERILTPWSHKDSVNLGVDLRGNQVNHYVGRHINYIGKTKDQINDIQVTLKLSHHITCLYSKWYQCLWLLRLPTLNPCNITFCSTTITRPLTFRRWGHRSKISAIQKKRDNPDGTDASGCNGNAEMWYIYTDAPRSCQCNLIEDYYFLSTKQHWPRIPISISGGFSLGYAVAP